MNVSMKAHRLGHRGGEPERSGSRKQGFQVIHPLADLEEEKRSPEGLGPMKMSKSVKLSLMALRAYLVLIGLLVAYHVLTLAHHHSR